MNCTYCCTQQSILKEQFCLKKVGNTLKPHFWDRIVLSKYIVGREKQIDDFWNKKNCQKFHFDKYFFRNKVFYSWKTIFLRHLSMLVKTKIWWLKCDFIGQEASTSSHKFLRAATCQADILIGWKEKEFKKNLTRGIKGFFS